MFDNILESFEFIGLGEDICLEGVIIETFNKLIFKMNVLQVVVAVGTGIFTVRGYLF